MKAVVRRVVTEGKGKLGGAKELAAAIEPLVGRGYVTQTVSAWMTGRADPPAHVMLAIAKVAGLSLDELVLGESLASRQDRLEGELRELRRLVETRPPLGEIAPPE